MLRFMLKERIADKEFRDRRRITVVEIANATGINRMTLSKLLNRPDANIQTEFLDRLCTYFGCRIEELVEHVSGRTGRSAKASADAKKRVRSAKPRVVNRRRRTAS
jgi:putative transcriptional regulator